jgi:hypothetical protein
MSGMGGFCFTLGVESRLEMHGHCDPSPSLYELKYQKNLQLL